MTSNMQLPSSINLQAILPFVIAFNEHSRYGQCSRVIVHAKFVANFSSRLLGQLHVDFDEVILVDLSRNRR